MSGWQKTGMRTLKSTDLELYLLAPWILKCMFCFFKLTCKIVRARQPAGATTLLCAVLWIWKNTSISSLIFCLKKKYHLKNAGIITHSFSIDFRYTVIFFFNCSEQWSLFFSGLRGFIQVLSKQPHFLSHSRPSHQAAGAGCWKWQWWAIAAVTCELSESEGVSQGAHTCHPMRSRADVVPSGRAASLWQERDGVCAERLYRLNFSSNATSASGKSLVLMLEGIRITLKTRSGFQNTTLGVLRGLPLP